MNTATPKFLLAAAAAVAAACFVSAAEPAPAEPPAAAPVAEARGELIAGGDGTRLFLGLPVYVLGHSMGGHVSALYGTKYPGEASGFILCAGVLRYHFMNFGWLPRPEDPEAEISPVDAAYGTLHLPGWKELSTFSAEGDDGTLKSISVSILNAFSEGINYLKKNSKAFVDPVLVLTGNNDMCVSPQDAIDFYRETGSADRSLRIYAGVGHFLMAEEKGHMIAPEIITWIEDRLAGGEFVDAGI